MQSYNKSFLCHPWSRFKDVSIRLCGSLGRLCDTGCGFAFQLVPVLFCTSWFSWHISPVSFHSQVYLVSVIPLSSSLYHVYSPFLVSLLWIFFWISPVLWIFFILACSLWISACRTASSSLDPYLLLPPVWLLEVHKVLPSVSGTLIVRGQEHSLWSVNRLNEGIMGQPAVGS